jgi:sugar transferase (PEP-CTERM/EpsH1 system associated)
MKKILFLTTRLPFPPTGGERLRPYHFIRHLSREHAITVLAFVESRRELESIKDFTMENVRIRAVMLPRLVSYLQCLGGLFLSQPLEVSYYASGRMSALVSEELGTGGYDLVFCHLLRMAAYVQDAAFPKVLDLCDALSLRYRLASRYRRGVFKVVERIEAGRLVSYEPRITDRFDLNIVSSSSDRDFLEKELHVKRLAVVENGVEGDVSAAISGKTDPRKIVFFSNMRTFHNVDAVHFFHKEILPLIMKKAGDAVFVVVGSSVPASIRKMDDGHSVRVYSDVKELDPFIRDACVSVAPMRIAVGIQNKIIQSMSLGIPVVTTSIGLGGIAARDGREVLVADTPEAFAEKVVMLLRDQALRNGIAAAARQLIKERYLWSGVVNGLRQKIAEVLSP